MTMIELPSIHFETVFDHEPAVVRPPVTIASGRDGGLAVVDGLVRGRRQIGRFESSPGLIGIRLATGGTDVRVTVRLGADGATASWWQRLVPERITRRTPYASRLLVVRSQGVTRAAVLLGRRPAEFTYDTSATVAFDLAGHEVPDDGLLVVELAEAAPGCGGASHAAIGVRVLSVEIAARSQDVTPAIGGALSAQQLIDLGLAGTGLAATSLRAGARLASDAFTVAPVDRTATWILRAGLQCPVRPDTLRARPGPLLPKRPTGGAAPRLREKAVALIRRKIDDIRYAAGQRSRHILARIGHAALVPIAWLLAGPAFRIAVRRGRITALVMPVSGATPVPCTIARRGRRTLAVTASSPITEPAVVRLRSRGVLGLTREWHLRSARFDG